MKSSICVTLLFLLAASTTVNAFSINKVQVDIAKAATAGVVAFGISITSPSPAFAANVENGEQLFTANCAACHAYGGNVLIPDKSLDQKALNEFLSRGRNEKSVIDIVTNGRNAMPAFEGRLDEKSIADISSYIYVPNFDSGK